MEDSRCNETKLGATAGLHFGKPLTRIIILLDRWCDTMTSVHESNTIACWVSATILIVSTTACGISSTESENLRPRLSSPVRPRRC